MSSAYRSREVHLTVKTAPKSPIRLVAAPRIFFRGVIQIRVEQVDKDLFVNNLFIYLFFFHLDHYDNNDKVFRIL